MTPATPSARTRGRRGDGASLKPEAAQTRRLRPDAGSTSNSASTARCGRRCPTSRRWSSGAAEAAFAAVPEAPALAEVSVALIDDATIRDLNRGFRGKDQPTNVLSFPAPPVDVPGAPVLLGDIAVALRDHGRAKRPPKRKAIADHLPTSSCTACCIFSATTTSRPRTPSSWRRPSAPFLPRSASPIPTPRATPTDQAMPDTTETRSPSPSADAAARAERGEGLFERLRAFLGPEAARVLAARRSGGGAGGRRRRPRPTSRPKSGRCSRTSSGCATLRVGDVMVPRADIVAVPKDIPLGELLQGVRQRRPFAAGGLWRDARRPGRHGPHPRPRRLPHQPRQRRRRGRRRAARTRPGTARPPVRLRRHRRSTSPSRCPTTGLLRHLLFVPPSMPAIDLLVKMQATPRPPGAGDRRIWRHRRPGLDRGHGRAGGRRHRGRARRRDGPSITREPDGSWIADARVGLDEVRETLRRGVRRRWRAPRTSTRWAACW